MNTRINKRAFLIPVWLLLWGCNLPQHFAKNENRTTPSTYRGTQDTANNASISWRSYFSDPILVALIDTALQKNQELQMTLQEIAISRNEVRVRKGEYLPFVGLKAGAGYDKDGHYTWKESVTENTNATTNREALLSNSEFQLRAAASWEVDIWRKLHNAKKAAMLRYLASQQGKNYMVTQLVAEIAGSYYELVALNNMLDIINKNVDIQANALHVIQLQKESAKANELAVNRFEAQLLHTQNLQYDIKQRITETENKINYLVGRFPQHIPVEPSRLNDLVVFPLHEGVPSQLLVNRPDVRLAELNLEAAKLDVKVARANFFPSLNIQSGVGFNAFHPQFLINPESIIYSLAGDLMAPLINRNAIKAAYNSANAKQIQAAYNYEQRILNAYVEVVNQLAKNDNLSKSYDTKSREVNILTQSILIADNLYKSARADYIEILTTQREALESKMDLVEIRMQQLNARIAMYRALGGGWQ